MMNDLKPPPGDAVPARPARFDISDVSERAIAMADVFGLSAGDVLNAAPDWADVREACANCTKARSCNLLLRRGKLAMPRDAAFCPNQHRFRRFWAAI